MHVKEAKRYIEAGEFAKGSMLPKVLACLDFIKHNPSGTAIIANLSQVLAALDYKTDANLRSELKKYTKDATCIIVAQRIGTIMNADKIIVLDEGKCVGIGTHKELLEKCDIYKQIALSQLSEEELTNGKK